MFPFCCCIFFFCCFFLFYSTMVSFSVLTAIFPGEAGLAGFIEAKDDGSGGDNWRQPMWCKAPVKSSPINQLFYRLDAFLSPNQQCQSTELENISRTCSPQARLGIPTLSLTTNSSCGYLGEGCYAPHQPSDAGIQCKYNSKYVI